MSRLVVAGVTLIVAVLTMLGASGWNRGAESPAVTLTEREVQVWGDPERDTAELRLRITYQSRNQPLDARSWLTEATLAQMGFPVAVPANAPEAERTYDRGLPRLGFVALEFDGPAWTALERERSLRPPDRDSPALSRPEDSRLVPVDAGPDPAALRARYAGQRVIVVPAVFRVRVHRRAEGGVLWGTMDRLVTEDVTGSIRLRNLLRALPRGARRYEVDLVIGRLGIPRIVDLRPR